MSKGLITFYFLLIMHCAILFAQEVPNEFFEFQSQKIFFDAGQDWQTNTIFNPIRYQTVSQSLLSLQEKNDKLYQHDSLSIHIRAGLFTQNDAIAICSFGHFLYKKHFYGYFYPRIVNNPYAFSRYTGKTRGIPRGGFKSGETDLSGIGFQNDWLLFQLGRGRQSWGAGNEIQLALSEKSPAYDYGMLGLNFGNFRARYFHGFLESNSFSINRYISGRGIEWSDQKSLLIGLSEIIIYSGENRPFDFAYFNPISTHLEIELNDRQNQLNTDSGNGIWQASIDLMARSNLKFSSNFLFDEFVFDDVEKDSGKVHGMAWSVQANWTPVIKKQILTIFGSWIRVGTHTFRHEVGYNNFVQRGQPLGWIYGSDGDEIKIGLNYFNLKNLICRLETGSMKIGSGTIKGNPYEPYYDYKSGPFPSGDLKETVFFKGRVQLWWQHNISIMSAIEWTHSNIDGKKLELKVGFDIYYPKSFNI